jgi:hypothetical protein
MLCCHFQNNWHHVIDKLVRNREGENLDPLLLPSRICLVHDIACLATVMPNCKLGTASIKLWRAWKDLQSRATDVILPAAHLALAILDKTFKSDG